MSSQLIQQSPSGAAASVVLCPNNLQVAGDQFVAGALSAGTISGLDRLSGLVVPTLGESASATNITYDGSLIYAVTPLNTGVNHYVNIYLPADFLTNNQKYVGKTIAQVVIANNNQLLNLNMYGAGSTPAAPGTAIIAYAGVQGTGTTMLTLTFYSFGVGNVINATTGLAIPYGIVAAYTTSSSPKFA